MFNLFIYMYNIYKVWPYVLQGGLGAEPSGIPKKGEAVNVWILNPIKPEPQNKPKTELRSIIKPEAELKSRPAGIVKPYPASVKGNFGSYRHVCEICKKAFSEKRHLTDHLRKHEGRVYKCEFCPKSFSGLRGLQLHTPIHTGKYPFHCSDCNAGFNYRKELEAHEAEQHGKELTSLNCKICRKAFANKRDLDDHERKHEGRAYRCEFCPKSFAGYRGLELHTPLHTGKYPFHCSQCNAGFNYRRELEACENKHQGKGFTCLNCSKIFYTENDFRKHQEVCAMLSKR